MGNWGNLYVSWRNSELISLLWLHLAFRTSISTLGWGGATKSKHVISANNLFSATAQLQDPSQLSAGQIQVGMTIKGHLFNLKSCRVIVVLKSQFVPMYKEIIRLFHSDSQYMEIESKKLEHRIWIIHF